MKPLIVLLALLLASPVAADVTRVTFGGSSGAAGGVTASGTNDFTGANTFWDTLFSVLDNADNTKILKFELSGITTGTTRTLTIPNASSTIAVLGLAQSWTAAQTFAGTAIPVVIPDASLFQLGTTAPTYFGRSGVNTASLVMQVPTDGRNLLIHESGDGAFNFSHANTTNPTIFVHSAAQSTTQWFSATHDGTNAVINAGTGGVVFPMTGSMGWSVVAGANTACNTTCTNAAVLGFDTAVSAVPVGPADATADLCLCAGAN